jgi:hypothetical protein
VAADLRFWQKEVVTRRLPHHLTNILARIVHHARCFRTWFALVGATAPIGASALTLIVDISEADAEGIRCPIVKVIVRREQRLKGMSSTKCKENLSANSRSPTSVPSAFNSAANWAAFIGHAAILSLSKPACRAVVACVHSRVMSGSSISGATKCRRLVSSQRSFRRLLSRYLSAHAASLAIDTSSARGIRDGHRVNRFFAVRDGTAACVGRLRSYHRKPGCWSGGRQELSSSVR